MGVIPLLGRGGGVQEAPSLIPKDDKMRRSAKCCFGVHMYLMNPPMRISELPRSGSIKILMVLSFELIVTPLRALIADITRSKCNFCEFALLLSAVINLKFCLS